MTTLPDLRDARDQLLARVAVLLEKDARVLSAWLTGSFGRGEADEWSDLDLHVAVADESFEALVAEADAWFAQVGEPILTYGRLRSNSMPGGYFWLVQYTPYMLQIDWNLGPVAEAVRPVDSHVLLERVHIPMAAQPVPPDETELGKIAKRELAFFWAMAPLALKFVGRGHTRLAVKQIEYLEGAYMTLWRVLYHPQVLTRDAFHQNRPLENELDALLPRFGPTIDLRAALEVIEQFCAAMVALHPPLAHLGAKVDARVVEEVAVLAEIAAVEAANGGSNPQRGSRR